MGEDNSVVEIFDLGAGKLIHTISDVKAPHSMVYRGDLKKLFIVDGGAGEVRIYDSDSYKVAGTRHYELLQNRSDAKRSTAETRLPAKCQTPAGSLRRCRQRAAPRSREAQIHRKHSPKRFSALTDLPSFELGLF
jgi:hypothetical protein